MRKEIEKSGKTIELALEAAIAELGVSQDDVKYEVIELPKKGFLGVGATPAKIKVIFEEKPADIALNFVKELIANMEIEASVEMTDYDGGKLISINGEEAGILIGHHGETLDSLQYLVNLAANKKDEGSERNYTRIAVDIENYRVKREETLRQLARRIANKVLKYKRSITFEPMNPYERRIIHSEIQKIEGVSTNSIGTENNRKVVVFCENGDKSDSSRRRKTERRNSPKSEDVSNFEREESFDDEYTLDETDLFLESADVTTDEDTEDTNE